MKKVKRFIIAGAIISCMSFSVISANTSYSSYETLTVDPAYWSYSEHPSTQTKTNTNTAGSVVVKSVGGNYEMYARMDAPMGDGCGKLVTISTGDTKSLPSNEYQKAGNTANCRFFNKLNTLVHVNCTTKWKSN